jgi:hypothetical protein
MQRGSEKRWNNIDPEGRMLRYSEIAILILVVTLIIWLNVPMLLAPAFLLTVAAFSAWRWHRGIWPWPPRRKEN